MGKRVYGIDLLRIFSMLGVVILHILGHGGVLETADSGSAFAATWLMEIIAYPAVNCFVLISGFVGYRDNKYYPKIKNIISLFFTVLFYSVIVCLILKIAYPDMIGKKDVLKSFFPVMSNQYWFFTNYLLMLLVSPMLNLFVHKADSKMLAITSCLIAVFTVLSMFSLINLDGGYSFVWFVMLYILGAFIKKEELFKKISTCKALWLVLGSILLTWSAKMILHFTGFKFSIVNENMFVSYCSVTMLAYAVGMVLIFAKIKVHHRVESVLNFLTPMVFSVYLIHDNCNFREILMKNSFAFANSFNAGVTILVVLGFALAIFVVCSLVDRIRVLLFKLLCIEKIAEKTECFIKSKINNR